MKKIEVFLLLMAAALFAAPALQDDFSKGLRDWRCGAQSAGQVQLHKTVQMDGRPCLEITGDPANPKNCWIVLYRAMKLEQGATYRLSFKYKTQVSPNVKKFLKWSVRQNDEAGKALPAPIMPFYYDKTDWTDYVGCFRCTPKTKTSYFYFETYFLESTDKVWITDFSIEKIVDDDVSLLVNGDFENGVAPWMSHQELSWWGQLYKTSPDTPFGKQCLDISGNPENKSNRLVILNQGLQNFEPDTEYLLSFQFRSLIKDKLDKSKIFYAHVYQTDDKGGRLRGTELRLPIDSDLWTYRQLTFKTEPNTANVAIHFCSGNLKPEDHIYLDSIVVEKAKAAGVPFDASKKKETPNAQIMKSDAGIAKIDPKTKLLASLELGGRTIVPASELASVIYASRGDREDILDANGTKAARYPFKATSEYSWNGREFREVVIIEATEDASGPFKIGVRHGVQPNQWDTLLCGLSPVRHIPATQPTVFTFGKDPNDLNLTQMDLYQGVVMPLLVLEGKDSYLAVGSHSYDDTVTFRPNIPQGYVPVVERNPISVKKGDKFRLELNWSCFDRKQYMLRDVWRTHVTTLTSNRPELKPYLPVHDPGPRVVVSGPMGAGSYFMQSRVDRLFPKSALWQSWFDDVNEDFPTTGSWWSGSNNYKEKMTPAMVKAHFDDLKKRGFSVISYGRTFSNMELANKTYPAMWLRKEPGGGVEMYGGGYRRQFPKHVAEDTGFKEIVWGMLDAFQPGCLDFLVNRYMKVIDTYEPWGLGWDCAGFDPSDFLVVATITQKIRDRKLPTKVVGNECSGPITAYLDWTMIENGIVGGKGPYDFEVVRAMPIPVCCLERFNLSADAVQNFLNGRRTWLWKFGLDWSKRYLAYLVANDPEAKNNVKGLEHSLQLTWYLYDLGQGASAGFIEEAKPVPESLVRMGGEVNGLVRVDRSFALRFPNGIDKDGSLAACAWTDNRSFRLAAYNEAAEPKEFRLRLDPAAFQPQGWTPQAIQKGEAFFVTPDGQTPVKLTFADNGGMPEIRCTLPAYTALHVFSEK